MNYTCWKIKFYILHQKKGRADHWDAVTFQIAQSKLPKTLNQSPHVTWFYFPDIAINLLSGISKISPFPCASVDIAIKWRANSFSACLAYNQNFSKHFSFPRQSLNTEDSFTLSKGKPMFQEVRDSNDLRWISCPLKTQPLVRVNGFFFAC